MKVPSLALFFSLLFAPLAHAAGNEGKPVEARLEVPQSIKAEYELVIAHLGHAVLQHGETTHLAKAARTTRDLIKAHFDNDAQFVFPPLGLLPALAEGRVTREMRPAVAMANRIKVERQRLFDENTRITTALNNLIAAAKEQKDDQLVEFATHAALRSLHEIEVLQPTAILIGQFIAIKLAEQQ